MSERRLFIGLVVIAVAALAVVLLVTRHSRAPAARESPPRIERPAAISGLPVRTLRPRAEAVESPGSAVEDAREASLEAPAVAEGPKYQVMQIRGEIRGPDGQPESQATVQLSLRSHERNHTRIIRPLGVKDGEYCFGLLVVPGERFSGTLTATHEDYLDVIHANVMFGEDVSTDFGSLQFFRRGNELSGTLLDPDDNPVPGISITAIADAPDLEEPSMRRTTDKQGRFRFSGLGPGEYRLECGREIQGLPEWIGFDGEGEAVDLGTLLIEDSPVPEMRDMIKKYRFKGR